MPKIEKMFAFVAEDSGPDDEGIMGISMGDLMMPLVGADQDRIKSLLVHAEFVSKMTDKPYRILEFSVRKDVTDQYLPK